MIVPSLAFIIIPFHLIPVSTYQLTEYLETITQIVIVVLGLLITYRIFTIEDSDIAKLMRSFKKSYKSEVNVCYDDDVEAGGGLAGQIARNYWSGAK